jgi:ubiquinone/menaquinone biosynthesis C-methylase UbiE
MRVEISRTHQAYCDFVEGLKAYVAERMMPQLGKLYERKAAAYATLHGRSPQTIEEVARLLEPTLFYRFSRCLQRISQEMMWAAVHRALEPYRAELIAELRRPVERPLGRLELNPHLELPDYYRRVEFHLQPGSYFGDELAGLIYDLAVPIYVLHRYGPENDEMGWALVSVLPTKPYRRILDMGCGIGQKTLPLVEAFPEAEVIGIDLSAPMLMYAHKRAEARGKRVIFSQQNAEQTSFSEESFDLVCSTLLLHELPESAIRRVIAESYRLLKPGGICAHLDLPPYREQSPYNAFLMDWDTAHNNEPYWGAFHRMDLPALYREVGFRSVREIPVTSRWGEDGFYTGTFSYWVTMGEK